MSALSFGRETWLRSNGTARAAGGGMLLLLAWFVAAPGSLALVWALGYGAIIVGFLYLQWANAPYVGHEPSRREIASVLVIAALWTVVIVVLYVGVLAIRFVIGSAASALGTVLGS